MRDKKLRGGWYYPNEFWFSPAYQSLSNSARDLLQCLLTEFKRSKLKTSNPWRNEKRWTVINNGDISFTEIDFKKLTGRCSTTYLKARNKLIEVGIIKQTYRGGECRGDRATYKILIRSNQIPLMKGEERWRRYPDENWTHDIPKPKKQMIGVKTQWKKGQSGRKTKATLLEYTLNGTNPPIEVDP